MPPIIFDPVLGALRSQDNADMHLVSASVDVSSLTSGYISIEHEAYPVSVKTNKGTIYPLEKGSITFSNGTWTIDPAPYLAYDDSPSFIGTWTVYFAGGVSS